MSSYSHSCDSAHPAIIGSDMKQPKCASTDEWIKKMVGCIYIYIYTPYIPYMEYYSAKERNKTGSFIVMWMALESIKQSELSQKE